MNEKTKSVLRAVLFAFIPLFICIVYAAIQGIMLWDINPFAAQMPQWCDEVYYYIQVKALSDGTVPLGYLGFNESTAAVGTFGAWSVFVLYPYAIIGRIFGMTPFMMIICNIIFMVAAFAVFYMLVKPTAEESIKIMLIFAAVPLIVRYTLSGMSEALFFAGSIVVAGFAVHFIKGRYSIKSIFACYVVVVYLALCRPYLLAFALIPLYFHFKLKKIQSIITFGASTAVFGAIYIGFVSPRCAEYFFPIVDLSIFSILLRKGPVVFIQRVKQLYNEGMAAFKGFYSTETWQVIIPYNLLKLVTAIVIICTLINFVKNKGKQLDKTIVGAISVVIVVAIVISLILLYVEYTSARHIIAIVVFMMFISAIYLPNIKNIFTIAVIAAVFYIGWANVGNADITYILSTDADEFGSMPIAQYAEKLENIFAPDADVDPWDNTVIYMYPDSTDININYCYYLPEYCGVNICESEWVKENLPGIKSKYIMTKGDEKESRFIDSGWEIIAKSEDYIVFKNTK